MSSPTALPQTDAMPSPANAQPQPAPPASRAPGAHKFAEDRTAKKKAKRRRHRIAIRRSHTSG